MERFNFFVRTYLNNVVNSMSLLDKHSKDLGGYRQIWKGYLDEDKSLCRGECDLAILLEQIQSQSNRVMRRILKIMPEYECYSIWLSENNEVFENINPADLDISQDLKGQIDSWEERYESTYDRGTPIESGFPTRVEKLKFEVEGLELWRKLMEEIPEDKIVFFSQVDQKVYEYQSYPYFEKGSQSNRSYK